MIRVTPSAVRTVAGIASTAWTITRACSTRSSPASSARAVGACMSSSSARPSLVKRAASGWVCRLRPAHHWCVCRAPVASPSRRRSASATARHSSRVKRLDALNAQLDDLKKAVEQLRAEIGQSKK